MKRGLNMNDRNTLRAGLEQGLSIQEIARLCSIPDASVVQKYLDSMDQDLVKELRARAPAAAGGLEELKAQIKAELKAEEKPKRKSRAKTEDFEPEPDYEDGL